ncbi:MAG: hypothetical protein AAF329_18050 [Cyanobacteria bacterium P01_A01_bin.17]
MKSPSAFKYAFAAVLSLTLVSGGTALHLSGQPTLTDSQDRIFDSATPCGPWAQPPCLAY